MTTLSFYKNASINVSAYVKSCIVSDPYVTGNTALANASSTAMGWNTFSDAESQTATTPHSSSSAASSIAVSA
jgi:hypothetical protein